MIVAFKKDLKAYKVSKGAVQFPLELVRRIVGWKVKETAKNILRTQYMEKIGRNFIIFLLASLIISATYIAYLKIERQRIETALDNILLTNEALDLTFQHYLENRRNDSERWLTVFGILSTLFAIFFVYTGFKIDSTKEKVDEAYGRIIETERKVNEDIYEYARQLEYCMSYIVQNKFSQAIDALSNLSKERFVVKDDGRLNTCCFFLAHCYYEIGIAETNLERKKENLAMATTYIDTAIAEPSHPLKIEIIKAFTESDSQN